MADKNTESTEVVEPKVKKERGPRIPRLERLQQEIEKAKQAEADRKAKRVATLREQLAAAKDKAAKAIAKVTEIEATLAAAEEE